MFLESFKWRTLCVSGVGLLLALGCAAPPPPKTESVASAKTELERFLPLENDTVFSYDTYIEDTNERGVAIFEIHRPRAGLAELSIAGQVRRRYYLDPGAVRSSQGGYLLKSPLALNSQWPGDDGTVRVIAVNQMVDVPAGKFAGCLQTVEEAKLASATRKTTTTFCPGVGITVLQIEAAQDATNVLQRLSLKSFGPRFKDL